MTGGVAGGVISRVGVHRARAAPSSMRDITTSAAMLVPTALLLLFTTVYPISRSLWLSFHTFNLSIPNAVPVPVGFENYSRLMSDPNFLSSMRITTTFVVVAVTLELVLGLAVGTLVAHQKWFAGAFRVVLILPFVLAPVAAGVLWRTMLNVSWGPVNWLLSLIGVPRQEFVGSAEQALGSLIAVEVWQQVPPVAFIVAAGIVALPSDLFRAAAIDGASPWQTFRRVTLPLLRPIIVVVLLLRVMDAFKVYDIIFTLTQAGPAGQTEAISYLIWKTGLRFFDVGYASAMSWALLLVVLAISVVFVRVLDQTRRQMGREL